MKQALPNEYDMNPLNMVSFTPEESRPDKGMTTVDEEFAPLIDGEEQQMTVTLLSNGEEPGSGSCRQIFKMNDGLFILEEEDADECEYFYSDSIEDLL